MALQTKQIADLNALNQKISTGYVASDADKANLAYAKTQGYNYTPMAEGATKINSEAGLQGLNESQLYRSGADIYKLPSVLSSDKITGATPTVQTVNKPNSSASLFMAGIGAGQNYKDLAQKQEEEKLAQTQTKSELEKRYEDLSMNASERKLQEKQQVYSDAGINTIQQEILNKRSDLTKLGEQFKQASQSQEGRAGLAGSIYGRQALIQKDYALKYGAAAADLAALQQNYTEAKKLADETLDLKYEDIETEIKLKKEQLDKVYNELSDADKKRADELTLVLDKQEEDTKLKKEEEKNISDLSIKVAEITGDSNLVKQIQNAGSYANAINLATPHLKTVGGLKDLGNGQFQDDVTGVIGTIDEIKQQQNIAAGIVTTSTGDAYDIKSYATDPNHEKAIQSILNGIGKFNTIQDIDNYIQSNYPGSKVTGQMIANAAGQYGVSWEMMVAIMAQDSGMGTKGLGAKNNNPGNIGQFDSLGTQGVKGYKTLQEGVNAVAKNLAWRKTTAPAVTTATTSTSKTIADAVIAGNAKLTDVPQKDRAAVIEEIQKSGQNVAELEQKQKTAESVKNSTVSLVDDLLNSSVLPNATGMFYWTTKIPGTGAYNLGRKFDQLRDLLAMGNIDKLKGAMSDKDIEFLRNSATSLSLKLSPEEFKKELNNIKNKLQNPTSSIGGEVSTGTSGVTSSGVGYTIE